MAKETYYLKPPKEQKFYRNFAKILTLLCIGDQRWWGFDEPRWGLPWFLYYTVVVTRVVANHIPHVPFLSQILQLYLIWDNVSEGAMGAILILIPISLVVYIIVTSAQRRPYIRLMRSFISNVHLYSYRDGDERVDRILTKVESYIRYTSYGIVIVTNGITVNWLFMPVLLNVKNIEDIRNRTKEFRSIIYFYMPFDYLYDLRNWTILHVINTFMTLLAHGMIDFSKILIYIFIFHWLGHINVFKMRIKEFRVAENCGKDLIGIIKYHIFILRVFSEIEEAFGIIITVTYLHNLIGDSLLLYNVMFGSKENIIAFSMMVVLFMGDLVLLSFVLEEIRRQTDELPELVYGMPWQRLPLRLQKTYLVFFSRVQPFEFVSACGLRTGVRPMLSILKSTFSYYVMLKTSMREG